MLMIVIAFSVGVVVGALAMLGIAYLYNERDVKKHMQYSINETD